MANINARKFIKKVKNEEYIILESLHAAQQQDDFYVILDGDYGGKVYMSSPVKIVKCPEKTLREILKILGNNQYDEGLGLHYERYCLKESEKEKVVVGGMGGGKVRKEETWVNPIFAHAKNILEELVTTPKSDKKLIILIKKLLSFNTPKTTSPAAR